MRIAFCVAEDINLGAGYIITWLKKQGHDVRLFFDPLQFNRGYAKNKLLARILSVESHNVKAIKRYNPDICCFSCVTAHYQWGLRMARKIKEQVGCKIVFGGIHATLVPEEVKRHSFIDDVVVGDGLDYFGGKFDPDNLWPDREIFLKELPEEHRKEQLFMTSFGCPFNCSFCGNEQLRRVGRHKIMRRSVKGCIEELASLKGKGMEYVLFVDDIFTCDKNWLQDFLRDYRSSINLPFACFVHPKFFDEGTGKLLRESGCHTAWMGVQTGHAQLRRDILNRPETNVDIINTAKLIKEQGIKLMVDHIFGIPFETTLTQDISVMLYNEIKPDVINCYNLLYFPKAKIIEHGIRSGYLTPGDETKINRGEWRNYQVETGQNFYDDYAKGMVAIPLKSIIWELLPMSLVKLAVHIKAGRAFMPIAIVQNEIFFTWRAILKKAGLYGMVTKSL